MMTRTTGRVEEALEDMNDMSFRTRNSVQTGKQKVESQWSYVMELKSSKPHQAEALMHIPQASTHMHGPCARSTCAGVEMFSSVIETIKASTHLPVCSRARKYNSKRADAS
jgi:hypothetical protein